MILTGTRSNRSERAITSGVGSTEHVVGGHKVDCIDAHDCFFHDQLDQVRRARELSQVAAIAEPWSGFKPFTIANRTAESPDVESFVLQPQDGRPLPYFKPGQFVTLKVNVPGEAEPVMRCYSLSDAYNPDEYRITVKRVDAPPAEGGGGVSKYLHDHMPEGSTVEMMAPNGNFYLDVKSPQDVAGRQRSVVLLGAGVGMTPLVSMAKSLVAAGSTRPVHFFISVRNGESYPMRAELEALADKADNVHLHVFYSKPGAQDVLGADYEREGRLSGDALLAALPKGKHEFFMCGPEGMMDDLTSGLRDHGVKDAFIHQESFSSTGEKSSEEALGSKSDVATHPVRVTLARGGTYEWNPGDGTVLKFLKDQGVNLACGCKIGVCGACAVPVATGKTTAVGDGLFDAGERNILTCVSYPQEGSPELKLDI